MKEKDEKKVEEIKGFSFMVEVIQKGNLQKQFIARVQGPQGVCIACYGTFKEFVQFIEGL